MVEKFYDKQGHPIPYYPFETCVPLDKKKWFGVTMMILKLEGLSGIDVYMEPGEWFDLKRIRQDTLWEWFLASHFSFEEVECILGVHTLESKKGKKVRESICIATNRPDKVILDTILHEIAHALTISDGHGKKWEAQFLRLLTEYDSFFQNTDRDAGIELCQTPTSVAFSIHTQLVTTVG